MPICRSFQPRAPLGALALACLALTATLPAAAQSAAAKSKSLSSKSSAQLKALPRVFVSPTATTDTPFFVGSEAGGYNAVNEYTPAGVAIRTIPFAGSPTQSGSELRGIAATASGTIVGFNGTFGPELDTFDPRTSTSSFQTAPNWEIANSGSSGAVGVYQGYTFVVNEGPNLGSGESAIIRFNPDGTNQ